jgi:hypothetical protein
VTRALRLRALLCCVPLFVSNVVRAIEIMAVDTERDGPAFLLRIEAALEAEPHRLMAVLTDYDHIHELHPDMLESRSLGSVGPATTEVYTRFEGCVLLVCRTLHRVERIRATETELHAEDVPERGSFREGRSHWRFEAEGSGTRLHYETRFVPDFWVPSLIGAGILAQAMKRMTLETMAEAEKRAAARND